VYFSDYGEEVYDYKEKLFCGRNEEAPSPAMYTVPFITWASTGWRKNRHMAQWTQYENRPFSSADFIYTLPQMIGINFSGMDPTRSLVSDTFTKHARWIGNPNQLQKLQDFDHIQYPKTSPPAIVTTPVKVNPTQQARQVSLPLP
jgi:heptose-I-phosphate ethanolaminephosphotransferase